MYHTLLVELPRDRLPPLTIPKFINRLIALHMTLFAINICILWWFWLILVLKIALYASVLSSSANWHAIKSQI